MEAVADLSASKGWKKVAYPGHPLTRPIAAALTCETWEADASFEKQKLEGCDAGLTTCETIVAQLGTILVSSASSGGRALSILPHVHVVIAESNFVDDEDLERAARRGELALVADLLRILDRANRLSWPDLNESIEY